MSPVDEIAPHRPEFGRRLRADEGQFVLKLPDARAWCRPALIAMGLALVLIGGVEADLAGSDARLGIAATEGFGPLGQVYGRWRPDVWPLRAAIARLVYLLGEPGKPANAAVLWPSAVATLAAGWIVARRFLAIGKPALALLVGVSWFGSWAAMGHAGSSGVDFLSGLATVATLDRLLGRRSDWIAGLWASAAFLCGGWPPLLVIGLAVLVLGRRDADFSFRLIAPAVVTATAWFFWTIETVSAEAAAAALVSPLTQRLPWSLPPSWMAFVGSLAGPLDHRPAWGVPLGIFLMGLPLSPFASLLAARSVRERLKADGGPALDWARIGLAAAICGTIVPGVASAAALPAIMGLLVASASALEAAWSGRLSTAARRAFLGLVVAMTAGWTFVTIYLGFVMTIVYTYYRPVGVVFAIGGAVVAAIAWRAVETASARRGVAAMLVLAACLKLAHAGFYVPEWTYRYGQGPWGRAIGQWLLPHWTLHTQHEWPEDLAFAINRPVRLLSSPHQLAFPETGESRHVLLLESEFENWPASAPKLVKVASFEPPTPMGSRRILARTEGTLTTPSGRLVSRVPAPQ